MNKEYEIDVEYDTLSKIQDRLKRITYALNISVEQMQRAMQVSQDFLAGNQFEKAKQITSSCTQLTAKTSVNINHAMKYLDELMFLVEEYGTCVYDEEIS